MATNLAIDDQLIVEAQTIGGNKRIGMEDVIFILQKAHRGGNPDMVPA